MRSIRLTDHASHSSLRKILRVLCRFVRRDVETHFLPLGADQLRRGEAGTAAEKHPPGVATGLGEVRRVRRGASPSRACGPVSRRSARASGGRGRGRSRALRGDPRGAPRQGNRSGVQPGGGPFAPCRSRYCRAPVGNYELVDGEALWPRYADQHAVAVDDGRRNQLSDEIVEVVQTLRRDAGRGQVAYVLVITEGRREELDHRPRRGSGATSNSGVAGQARARARMQDRRASPRARGRQSLSRQARR